MCRSTIDGGRRCPSHTDPVLIANRNERRRAKYAEKHKQHGEPEVGLTPVSPASILVMTDYENYKKHIGDSSREMFEQQGGASESNELGISRTKHSGLLVDNGYLSEYQLSGKLDYTKLDPVSFRSFGFQDPDEARFNQLDMDELKSLSQDELANIGIAEQKALRTYTGNSYEDINEALYNDDPLSRQLKTYPEYESVYDDSISDSTYSGPLGYPIPARGTREFLKDFDSRVTSAMSKAPQKQRIVYRGIKRTHPSLVGGLDKYVDDQLSLGQEVKFDGYQSTSVAPGVALTYSGDDDGLIFEIKTPSGINVSNVSGYDDEREVILPRGGRYTVVGVHKKVQYTVQDVDSEVESDAFARTVTIVQLVEINETGYIRDESNYSAPPALTDLQLNTP
jgi:hypothetical protein